MHDAECDLADEYVGARPSLDEGLAGGRVGDHLLEGEGREILPFRDGESNVQGPYTGGFELEVLLQLLVYTLRLFVCGQQSTGLGLRSVKTDQQPLALVALPKLFYGAAHVPFLPPPTKRCVHLPPTSRLSR